jgi:orotidine-5'-phosphate decarboxylase
MYQQRMADTIRQVGTPLCVGLDPVLSRLPGPLQPSDPGDRPAAAAACAAFCQGMLEVMAGEVGVVKPQSAFFEVFGASGIEALEEVVAVARRLGMVVVLDAKRGDIGSTAEAYATAAFDACGADAVTVSPWLGPESLAPFVARCPARGLFVLVRTSNPGAAAFQGGPEAGPARAVADWIGSANERFLDADGLGPVGAVVGATLGADERAAWRARLPNAWILAPGFGAQGALAGDLVSLARSDGGGVIPVAARSVAYPPSGRDDADWQRGIHQRLMRHRRQLREAWQTFS